MSQVAAQVHEFTVTLAGAVELTVAVADAVYEAGCGDASLWSEGPTLSLTFHREAESLADAVASAIRAVEKAGFKVARVDVESDFPVCVNNRDHTSDHLQEGLRSRRSLTIG